VGIVVRPISRREAIVALNSLRLSGFNVNRVGHGQPVSGRKCDMLDQEQLDQLNKLLNDRFSAEEICEILNLTVDDLFDKFIDEILEVNWEELL
jgi:hypothetical protein